jgi:hypothetical protein
MHMFVWYNFVKMTNPGSDLIFNVLRELRGTLWDLVGHLKIDFRHYAHVSIVEYCKNKKIGDWDCRTRWNIAPKSRI